MIYKIKQVEQKDNPYGMILISTIKNKSKKTNSFNYYTIIQYKLITYII